MSALATDPFSLAFRPLAAVPGQLTALFALLAVLGAALLSGILIAVGTSQVGEEGASGFDLLPVAMGMSLSGQVHGSVETFLGDFQVQMSMLALGTLALIGTVLFQLARRRRHLDGSWAPVGAVALRSGAEALAVSLLTAIMLGFLTVDGGPNSELEVRGSFMGIFLVVLLVVFAALFLGRAGDVLLGRLPATVAGPLREVGALVSYAFRFMAPLVLVGGFLVSLFKEQPTVSALLPVYLGNLVTGALALGTFGAVRGATGTPSSSLFDDGGEQGSGYQFAWDVMGAWSVLLFLAVLVLVVVLAAGVGVRRPRLAGPDLSRVWQLPVLAWGVSLVLLHLLAPVGMTINGLGKQGDAGIGFGWWSSLTLALLATAVSVLAEYVPVTMYSFSQPLLRLCAGSAATDSWLAGPGAAVPAMAASSAGAGAAPTGGFPAVQTGAYPAVQTGAYQAVQTVGYPAAAAGGSPEPQTSAYPVAQPSQAAPAPAPLDPAARKRIKLIGGGLGVLVLLLAAGAGGVAFLNSSRTPQAVVQSYLQLVADGKASEANAVVDPGVPNDQRTLLTDEVLQAAKSRIVVGEVKEVESKGDSRTVQAVVSLDGKSHDMTIKVHKGPRQYGLLDSWKIDTPAVQKVGLSGQGLQQVVVSGAPLDFPEKKVYGYSTVEQYAYFGIYDLALPEGQAAYLEPVNSALTVAPIGSWDFGGQQSTTTIEVQATDKLKELVLTAVKEKAESCVKPESREEEGCPWLFRNTKFQSLEVGDTGSEVEIQENMSFSGGPVTFKYQEAVTSWRPSPKVNETKYKMQGSITFPDGGGDPEVEVTRSNEHFSF